MSLALSADRQAAARRRAILCVLGSSAAFAMAAAMVKAVVPTGIPVIEAVFVRSIVAVMFLLPALHRAGGPRALRTRQPGGHALRTLAGFSSQWATFYAYAVLPLATVTALGFAMPLCLTALSVPLLGERIGGRRLMAVLAGFAGVLLIVQPWAVRDTMPAGPAAIMLVGVVGWALAMISIRRMGRGGESNLAIVLIFSIACSVLSGIATVPVWVMPHGMQWVLLVGVGMVSTLAQMLMTEGYRSGEVTLLAPFEYGAILYTTLLGLLLWDEWPRLMDLVGIGVLVLAGLWVWRLETRAR